MNNIENLPSAPKSESGRVTSPGVSSHFDESDLIFLSSSKFCSKNYAQLELFKSLLEENQLLRAKLAIEIDPKKAKYEDNLKSVIQKKLGTRFNEQ